MTFSSRGAYATHALLSVGGEWDDGTDWVLDIHDLDSLPSHNDVDTSLASYRPQMFPVFWESNTAEEKPNTTARTGDITVNAVFLCVVEHPVRLTESSVFGPRTIDVQDTYLNMILGYSDLADMLDGDLSVTIEPGVYPWDGKDYAGFIVRQTWEFLVN